MGLCVSPAAHKQRQPAAATTAAAAAACRRIALPGRQLGGIHTRAVHPTTTAPTHRLRHHSRVTTFACVSAGATSQCRVQQQQRLGVGCGGHASLLLSLPLSYLLPPAAVTPNAHAHTHTRTPHGAPLGRQALGRLRLGGGDGGGVAHLGCAAARGGEQQEQRASQWTTTRRSPCSVVRQRREAHTRLQQVTDTGSYHSSGRAVIFDRCTRPAAHHAAMIRCPPLDSSNVGQQPSGSKSQGDDAVDARL